MSGILTMDGYDDCVIGIASVHDTSGEKVERVIYDAERIIAQLLAEGCTDRDEAVEHIEFNMEGAYVGKHTPIIVWPVDLEQLRELDLDA